jgi:branched-chain amino acid transport system ATP-binding protein
MNSASRALLEVQDLSKSFRGVRALDAYTLQLAPLAIHGVIGPNGAGKTTLFNLLTGFLNPTSGAIHLRGRNISHMPTAQIARLGIARTFQNIRLFGNLAAIENVKVALQSQMNQRLLGTLISSASFLQGERELEVWAMECLELVGLTVQRDRLARSLPYGDQRRLEIARAIAIKPQLLLLDEPTAGMNPSEAGEVLRLIRRLRDELGITIMLVAHDIPMVMNLCEQIQVLNYGKLIAEGDPGTVRNNPEVIAAYLGQAKYA